MSKDFKGCASIRGSGEYPELPSPLHQQVARREPAARAMLEVLLTDLGVAAPKLQAGQLQLMLERAIVTVHAGGDSTVLGLAREAALVLVRAA
jgi:hypothetical protein